ncbi:MAG: acyltransferase family protein [Hyphomonadaceae bacterium]|nr:acyltransferase family protein [Hyphomonadaceae bacterium]
MTASLTMSPAASRPAVAHAGAKGIRLDIQGLRAIAVVAVLIYHFAPALLPGGYAGVDVFFVISGYLIGGILLGEIDEGRFSLRRFYERRVKRLFPALFTMLATVLLLGALLLSPSEYAELGRTVASTVFFLSNMTFLGMTGYFETDAQYRPLIHTWSLAVEEQFYLLFPLFLFVCAKFLRKRLRLILALGALASLGLCEFVLHKRPDFAFFVAPLRGYELLIGAAIAGLSFPAWPRWVRDAMSLAGLAVIIGSLFLLNDATLFPGLAAAVPCLGTAMMLFAGAGADSVGGRLISGPVFALFGAISYSLYLWHQPLLVFTKEVLLQEPEGLELAVSAALSVAVAYASWRFIERPALQADTARLPVLSIAAAGMVLLAGAGWLVSRADGFPARYSPAAQAMLEGRENYSPKRWECHNFVRGVEPYEGTCVFGDENATPDLAVWADSHGVEFAYALGERLQPMQRSLLALTASGCPPASGFRSPRQRLCRAQNDVNLAALAADARIHTVILVANYIEYPRAVWPDLYRGMDASIAALRAAGKQVVVIGQIPDLDIDPPGALAAIVQRGGDPLAYGLPRADYERESAGAQAWLREAGRQPGVSTFEPAPALCDQTLCPAMTAGEPSRYFNADHVSMTGARLLVNALPEELIAAPAPAP